MMRVKRAVVLGSLLTFLALTFWLTSLATSDSSEAPIVAGQDRSDPIAPAPKLDSEAGSDTDAQAEPMGIPVWIVWSGAVATGSGAVVSFLVFRVEVRGEKAKRQVRRNREDYYKDLRRYNNQLKGPPRHNT